MYELSKYRYRELKYFCLQYGEMLEEIKKLSVKGYSDGHDDITANTAVSLADLIRAYTLIEKTAYDTDGRFGGLILRSVTEDVSVSRVCCTDGFDDLRHKFFYLLHENKGL